MTSLEIIHRLRTHQRWANRRLLDACRPLSTEEIRRPFEIGQGTVLAMLTHLYAAEWVWLASIEGDPDPISPFELHFDTFDELGIEWAALDGRWATFYAGLTDADLNRPVSKRSTSSGAGKIFTTPLAEVLLHLYTHAQYTSAQLKNMLRHLGVEPLPDIMLMTQCREA